MDRNRLVPRLPDAPALFDERSDPDFRTVFGCLCARSTELDIALTSLRLSTLDLTSRELDGIRRLRLMLARVDAVSLDVEAHALLQDERRGATLRRLGALLERGVIEIRAAPLAGWSPDFTIFVSDAGPEAALTGYHWFQRPFPHRGPALAALHGPREARRVRARYEEAWGRAHDIASAFRGILRRSRGAHGDGGREQEAPRRDPTGPGRPGERGARPTPKEGRDEASGRLDPLRQRR